MSGYLQRLAMRGAGLAAGVRAIPRHEPLIAAGELGALQGSAAHLPGGYQSVAVSEEEDKPVWHKPAPSRSTSTPAPLPSMARPERQRAHNEGQIKRTEEPAVLVDHTPLSIDPVAARAPSRSTLVRPERPAVTLASPVSAATVAKQFERDRRFGNAQVRVTAPRGLAPTIEEGEAIESGDRADARDAREPESETPRLDRSPESLQTLPAAEAPPAFPVRKRPQPTRAFALVQTDTPHSAEQPDPASPVPPVLRPRNAVPLSPPAAAFDLDASGAWRTLSPIEISIGQIDVRVTQPQLNPQPTLAQPRRSELSSYANMRRYRDRRWY